MLSLGKCDQIDQDLNKLCFSCFVPKGGYIICLMLSLYLGPKVNTLSVFLCIRKNCKIKKEGL